MAGGARIPSVLWSDVVRKIGPGSGAGGAALVGVVGFDRDLPRKSSKRVGALDFRGGAVGAGGSSGFAWAGGRKYELLTSRRSRYETSSPSYSSTTGTSYSSAKTIDLGDGGDSVPETVDVDGYREDEAADCSDINESRTLVVAIPGGTTNAEGGLRAGFGLGYRNSAKQS